MKTKLSLLVIMTITLLIPQQSQAISCFAASYNFSIAQGNLNFAEQNNLPTLWLRIAVADAREQLQMCEEADSIGVE